VKVPTANLPQILIAVSLVGVLLLLFVLMFSTWGETDVIRDDQVTQDTGTGLKDTDGDGISDLDENYIYGTDMNDPDTDGDGLPDGWEVSQGLDPRDNGTGLGIDTDTPVTDDGSNVEGYPNTTEGKDGDPDGDGLTNLEEYDARYILGVALDPLDPDTDGDGMFDGWEMVYRNYSMVLGRWTLNASDPSDAILDPDNDGLTNLQEFRFGTNPNVLDSDGDGLSDFREVMTYRSNPNSNDTDSDTLPDLWETDNGLNASDPKDAYLDSDGDGLTNKEEYGLRLVYGNWTNPSGLDLNGDGVPDGFDTDRDGMPDGWEVGNGLNPLDPKDADLDSDHDGADINGDGVLTKDEYFTNLMEYQVALLFGKPTDPRDNDTDGDGLMDGVEVSGWDIIVNSEIARIVSNPLIKDTDDDGISDRLEKVSFRTNASSADSDGDTLSDFEEVYYTHVFKDYTYKTNATDRDTDSDMLSDSEEITLGMDGFVTNATNPDTDGDTLTDGKETLFAPRPFQAFCDPTRKDTDGDGMEDGWEMTVGDEKGAPSYSVLIAEMGWEWDDQNMSSGAWLWHYNETWEYLGNETMFASNVTFGWLVDPTHAWDRDQDPDRDTLSNYDETPNGWNTNPVSGDTDGDLLPDGWEVNFATWSIAYNGWTLDPANSDSDGDGVLDGGEDIDADGYDSDYDGELEGGELFTNYEEYLNGTNPTKTDSDNDGMGDGYEVYFQDSDSDGMPDGWERENGLNPNDPADASKDADYDGYTNLQEYMGASDPHNPGSKPRGGRGR